MAKIGDALKKAVESDLPKVEGQTKRGGIISPLMNGNRRRIFQFLCNKPCCGVNILASSIGLSRATVKWHLKVLVNSEYLEAFRYRGNAHYCPQGMVSSEAAKMMMATLNDVESKNIYMIIMETPGIDLKGLRDGASAFALRARLKELESCNLIQTVKDGRMNRFFATQELARTVDKEKVRLKAFRRTLINKLERDFLGPEVKDLKGEGLVIQIKVGAGLEEIVIPYHPIEGILTT